MIPFQVVIVIVVVTFCVVLFVFKLWKNTQTSITKLDYNFDADERDRLIPSPKSNSHKIKSSPRYEEEDESLAEPITSVISVYTSEIRDPTPKFVSQQQDDLIETPLSPPLSPPSPLQLSQLDSPLITGEKDSPLITGEKDKTRKKFDRDTLMRARTSSTTSNPASEKSPGFKVISDCLEKQNNKRNSISSSPRSGRMSVGDLEGRSDNRWTPNSRSTQYSHVESVSKSMKGILNKLTPEMFDTLAADVCQIDYTQPGILTIVTDLLVETALLNPFFSSTYAELASVLNVKWPKVKNPQEENSFYDFKAELLERCQKVFLERGNLASPSPNVDQEEIKLKKRLRMMNNIIFIGKLYCKQILPAKIIDVCVRELVDSIDTEINDEEIEALCKLITTTGKIMEQDVGKNNYQYYIDELTRIAKLRISSRVQFMILDLIELRDYNWEPRLQKEAPQKLADIRKSLNSPYLSSSPNTSSRRKKSDSISSPSPSRSPRSSPRQTVGSPMMAPLLLPPSTPSKAANSSGEVVIQINGQKVLESNGLSKEEHSSQQNQILRNSAPTPAPMALEEPIEERVGKLLKEYFAEHDFQYLLELLTSTPDCGEQIVHQGLCIVFESKPKTRELFVKFICQAYQQQLISKNSITNGCISATATLEDLVCDAPLSPTFTGIFLANLCCQDVLDWTSVRKIINSLQGASFQTKITESMVAQMKQEKDLDWTTNFLNEAGKDFNLIFGDKK